MTTKSLVLISYVFPPDSAIGAVRVGKFAAGLARDHRWSVQAVVPRACQADPYDPDSSGYPGLEIHKTRELDMLRQVNSLRSLARRRASPEPPNTHADANGDASPAAARRGALARLSDLIAVPDRHSGWIYFAFREAARCARRGCGAAVLFSSGPPHSAHVAAAMAKRRTGRPWVADLRDPWTDNPYNAPLAPLAERWNRRLERRVLESADVILCTTEPARERLLDTLPDFSPDRIVTVPNGYDSEDFRGLHPRPRWPQDGRPVMLHAGSVYGRRDPSAFLQALLLRHAEAPGRCPRAVFLGNWDEQTLARTRALLEPAREAGLVTLLPAVPRRESLEIQAAADWLILLGDSMPEMLQVPGKLFEYLAMRKPVFSLFPEGAPVEPYLAAYARRHRSAAPDDAQSILASLRSLESGAAAAESELRSIDELERSHQVGRVNAILEAVLEQRALNVTASRESEAAAVVP